MSLNPQETTTAVRQYASDDNAPSSAKKPKPALARSTPIKGFFRTARPETQSTPSVHRALIESSDFGNGSSSSQESSGGQENQTFTPSNSPPEPSQHESFMPKLQSVPFRTPGTRSRAAATFDGEFGHGTPAKSSPLKRNDGAMKLNSSTFGSPSAKRRSLYGVPFEIAHDLANINTPEDTKMAASDGDSSSDDHPFRSTLARGYAGSRRPNVQQRLAQKVGANRNRRSLEITYASPQPVRRTSNMSKGRTSLDSALPQQEPRYEANEMRSSYRDGVALMDNIRPQHARNTRQHPHPLSQALTPTSITPTLTDDPGTISMAAPSPMGAPKPFSKSLPIGALRPTPRSTTSTGPSDTSGTEGSFATPKFFNIAKPDPAAFRSTGLISKRHRNPDELPPPPPGHADMPDTPCKKASSGYYVSPSPNVAHSISKPTFGQPAFGTPSNPFNLHTHKPAPDSFSKSIALFQKDDPYDKSNRRVSFTSIDGDDMVRSPSQAKDVQGDSQSSADELPPTPTKHASSLFGGKTSSLRSSLFGRRASVGPNTFFSPASNETLSDRHQPRSKLSQSGTMSELNGSNAGKLGPSDLANLSLCPSSFKAPPSFARSRFQKRSTCKTPFPLSHKNLRTSGPKNAVFDCTKANTRSPVSQCTNGNSSGLPFTPADTGFPDPSVLSISPNSKMPISPSLRHGLGSSFIKPPETPTSHRDSGQTFASSLMMTPSHNAPVTHDIDQVLKYRFKKVEWYAKGEFSEVYKVYQPAERQSQSYFSPAHGLRPLQKQLPDQVFVVKKSKAPHSSYKLLEKKFREVSIMKALGKSDHTVFLIDSWEANHHLYLQTEYCEEGSLDTFLLRQGRDGRLDDFRIWKIMVELASGVKHIHESGFIHLDLKPENVFIDFEGTLKIGDFGLASTWPAPPDVEGEGDRRYIGPDLLYGAFDKPADIFALGMIMYEIAANFIPPDNGGWWQKLRSGDFSGLPSLTSGSSHSLSKDSQHRLNTGHSLDRSTSEQICEPLFSPDFDSRTSIDTRMTSWTGCFPEPSLFNTTGAELLQPPIFMLDPEDRESLDNVVHWMMSPDPGSRPVVDQILRLPGCEWVSGRRRAGAVIYEGRWGPADHVLGPKAAEEDAIMADV